MHSVCLFVCLFGWLFFFVCRFCPLDDDWFAASLWSLITCEVQWAVGEDVDERYVFFACLPCLYELFVGTLISVNRSYQVELA